MVVRIWIKKLAKQPAFEPVSFKIAMCLCLLRNLHIAVTFLIGYFSSGATKTNETTNLQVLTRC